MPAHSPRRYLLIAVGCVILLSPVWYWASQASVALATAIAEGTLPADVDLDRRGHTVVISVASLVPVASLDSAAPLGASGSVPRATSSRVAFDIDGLALSYAPLPAIIVIVALGGIRRRTRIQLLLTVIVAGVGLQATYLNLVARKILLQSRVGGVATDIFDLSNVLSFVMVFGLSVIWAPAVLMALKGRRRQQAGPSHESTSSTRRQSGPTSSSRERGDADSVS